jgi:hypothetical protein
LEDDGGDPARYPNSYKNPLAQITFNVPEAPRDDPQRGPKSPGINRGRRAAEPRRLNGLI